MYIQYGMEIFITECIPTATTCEILRKEFVEAKHMSADALAKAIDVPVSTFHEILSGGR